MNYFTHPFAIVLSIILYFFSMMSHANAPIPQFDENIHLGVATCSGSTCHGATQAFDTSSVLQNEYITWQREDKHSKAFKILYNEDSKRIARNLGLESAASAKICLDCHTDYVPKDKRGKRFQLSDGIGCEACHGGAEKYLGPHVSGIATHEENIANGLYPSEHPIQRAKLCLSCHLGTKNKFATHRIMGAGHPRLSFELDTYTATAPAHYKIDADYRERKAVWSHARTWAVGQAMAVQSYLNLLTNPSRLQDGLFPELSLFECYACHQSMKSKRWVKRSTNNLKPGTVRLQDSNLLMLRHIVKVLDPNLANAFQSKTLKLHQASTQSTQSIINAAKALKQTNNQLINKIAGANFSSDFMFSVLKSIIDDGVKGHYIDYASAEQTLMAVEALATTLSNAGKLNISASSPVNNSLNKMYDLLGNDDKFSPGAFSRELKAMQSQIF